jgi:hypothetical protein
MHLDALAKNIEESPAVFEISMVCSPLSAVA